MAFDSHMGGHDELESESDPKSSVIMEMQTKTKIILHSLQMAKIKV